MLSELRKSIATNLYERTTSPLYGAFIVSWCFWNWKIIYVTFFIDSTSLDKNKIEWISENFSLNSTFLYPLYSTCLLILVMPFISNAAYWLSLRFKKWKLDQKNTIEKRTLLTLEQSIQLRQEIAGTEEKLEKILDKKNKEIKNLEIELEHLRNLDNSSDNNNDNNKESSHEETTGDDKDEEAFIISMKINKNKELNTTLKKTMEYIQGGYSGLSDEDNISKDSIAFFESNRIIERNDNGTYRLTDFGKNVMKHYYNKKF